MSEEEGRKISFFERYLTIWVVVCIGAGILISRLIPGISQVFNAFNIGQISVPIGICLFLMMYPAMLNLQ
ncbi:MAG: arsenical-resistance protein, partial [Candidatus Lokiarchaeota archaeon]|nr:arsenical-resistance protein [Candidatus Lokiarchaeota archaeon]